MSDMKTLRVCLSSELPPILERSFDYIYLAYDKLALYNGQNEIEENFVITENIPDEPVPGMIYILNSDGSVHRQIDYSDVKIAEIEEESQIEILKKAGTLFFVYSDRRYLDSQTRTLTLPFNNGTYEMSVAVKNDQVFDNNTILKYNAEHERFEIYGEQSEEFIDFSKPFRGGKTNSINVNVDGPRITADVLISKVRNNILKRASDGLYVNSNNIVRRDVFETWSKDVSDFKKYAQDILDRIDGDMKYIQELITEESINNDIMKILRDKYDDINIAMENYQQVVDKMDSISNEIMSYAVSKMSSTSTELITQMEQNSKFDDLDDLSDFKQEVDYYKKAEEYIYPSLTEKEVKVIIAAAIQINIENINIL